MNKQLTLFYTPIIYFSILFFLGLPNFSFADLALANQNLRQAIDEIEVAKNEVIQAQKQEPTGERIQFHYDWVLSDLNQVEGGIQAKFNQPDVEPRVIQPIAGDYLSLIGNSNSNSVGESS